MAFDRAIAMVEHSTDGSTARSTRGVRSATRSTREVCEHGYNAKLSAFVQSYDADELDASVLMIPLVGFLPGDDPRVASTIDAIDRELTVDGLCSATTRTDDGRRDRRTGGRVPAVQLLDGRGARRDRPARRDEARDAASNGCWHSPTTSACSPRSTTP